MKNLNITVMENNFYKLPLKFDSVFENTDEYLKTCSEKESIDQFLETLIMTCPGEHKFDREFGCKIWEMDFVRMTSPVNWEKDFRNYLLEAIGKFEHRITDVDVTASIVEETQEDSLYKSVSIRKRATVIIKTKLVSTGENVAFYYTMYLGPISSK